MEYLERWGCASPPTQTPLLPRVQAAPPQSRPLQSRTPSPTPRPPAVTWRAARGAEGAGTDCFHGSGASAGNFPELRGKLSRTPPAAGRAVGRSAVPELERRWARRSPSPSPVRLGLRRRLGSRPLPLPPPPRPAAPPPGSPTNPSLPSAARPPAGLPVSAFVALWLSLSGLTSAGHSPSLPALGLWCHPLLVQGVVISGVCLLSHLLFFTSALSQILPQVF